MPDSTCPPECRKEQKNLDARIEGHRKTLYGSEGTGGLVRCVQQKVSKKVLGGSIIGILTVVAMFILYSMGSYAQEKEKRQKNTSDIQVLNKSVENHQVTMDQQIGDIKSDMAAIKRNQELLMRKQITRDDLVHIMEEAIQKSKQ